MRKQNHLQAVPTAVDVMRLLTFPSVELAFVYLAWRQIPHSLIVSAICIVCASVALSYSLHIVFHEIVHRRYFKLPICTLLAESTISLLLGIPFNEYRQSHWRHHRYINRLEDSTSTWVATAAGPQPNSLLRYSLSWPVMIPRSVRALLTEYKSGIVRRSTMLRIVFEATLLMSWQGALACKVPLLWAIYNLTIYLGWTGIAAINYVQHPPKDYGTGYTTSVYSSSYNYVFYNNGLHIEHHDHSQEPVIKLSGRRDRMGPSSGSRQVLVGYAVRSPVSQSFTSTLG